MPDPASEPGASEPSPNSASDKRRQARFACLDGTRLKLSVCPEFRCRRGLLMDVSTGGIGVVLEEALPAGTRVVFEVLASPGGPGLSRMAKVRHCRKCKAPEYAPWQPPAANVSAFFRTLFRLNTPQPAAEGWFIGCEFETPMVQDDVDRLMAMLRTGTESD